MADELNDIATQTRLSVATQLVGAGLIIGGIDVAVDHLGLGLVLMLAGLLVTLVWTVVVTTWARRSQRRLVERLDRGTHEVVEGRVAADQVPARVVRRRGGVAVVTVLAPGRVHRRALLVPPDAPALVRGTPVLVGLHPSLGEVAVLVRATTAEQVAAADADPRWREERVPRDRDVMGGWGAVALAGLVGFGVGLGLALLVGAVA